MPQYHIKYRKRPQPCPSCRKTRLKRGGYAVLVCSSGTQISRFRCRSCGHRWKLPVRYISV